MKKYLQNFMGVCAIALSLLPTSAFAAASFNNGGGDLPTLQILNATRTPNSTTAWTSSVGGDAGDVISLQIYYRNTSTTEDALNTRAFVTVPSGSASTFNISGGVVASNAAQATSNVTLNLSSGQTLTYIPGSFRFFRDQSVPLNNPSTVPPNGQSEQTILTSNGMVIGTIRAASGSDTFAFQGNIVVQFRVGNSGSGTNNPTITTNTISTGSCTDATLTGFVNANGNTSVQTFFEFSTNGSMSNPTITATQTFGNTSTSFSQFISGLAQNTTFFVRANARGTNGQTVQGGITSFNTQNCNIVSNPTVSTNSALNVNDTSANLSGFVNANGNANTTVFFQFGTNGNLGNTTSSQTFGNTSTNFSQFISNLSPNTTYSFRAVAQGTNGQQVFGNTLTFTTTGNNNNNNGSLPFVQTNQATNLFNDGAQLNGFVNANGNSFVTTFFEFGPLGTFNQRTATQNFGNASSNFSQVVTGLNQNTIYSFRAVAQGSNGQQVFGNTQNFTTGQNGNNNNNNNLSLATVTTNSASSNLTSCTFNGFLNSVGFGSGSANVSFEFGTNSSFLSNRTISQSISAGSFSSTQSLSPNTTYFFRAIAQNNAGTAFGSIQSCVTGNSFNNNNNGSLNVQTLPATFIAHDSALLNGSLSTGSFTPASVWFEYGPAIPGFVNGQSVPQNLNFPSQTFVQTLGATNQTNFNRIVVGLSPNRTYFYRAMANVNGQVSAGSVLAFTTGFAPSVPVVVTPSAIVSTGPIGFSKVTIAKTGLNLSFPNGARDCFAARPGDTVEYTIEVRNTGSGSATNLTVTDTLSGFYDFLSSSNGAVQNGNQLSWNLGTLSAGETRLLSYQLRVRSLTSNVNADNIATLSNGVSSKQSNVVHAILLNIPGGVITQVSAPTTVAPASINDAQPAAVATVTDSTTFFPNSALGWLGLLILIILVALLIRALV